MTKMRLSRLLVLLPLVALWAAPAIAATKAEDDASEIKMGNEAAAETEKFVKILHDPALQLRVDTIGKAIAAVATTTEVKASYGKSRLSKFDYVFKITDDKDVNAFALPAGHVYVNKGLLDFVQSDHELAGVLAHEIAHDAHHHMIALIREQSKLNNKMALVLLAALIGKMPGRDLGNVMMGAQLLQIAKLSGYGQQAEEDADRTAVDYLAKTEYNPVGILTFMERLSNKTPYEGPNFAMTHPVSGDRCATIISRLNDLKIPVKRRAVSNVLKAVVKTKTTDGKEIVDIAIEDKVVMSVADGDGGQPAKARAQQIADKINDVLDSGVQLRDVRTIDGGSVVLSRDVPVFKVSDGDAVLVGSTAPQVAKGAANAIKSTIWKQMMDLAMIPTTSKSRTQ